ncbi:MAG: hypothetical protein HZB26_23660 [Candidatus Hydrogenedentes bacterium]|nr:hypothetical protein [Candidatus Hydrogenedentota bacterium]
MMSIHESRRGVCWFAVVVLTVLTASAALGEQDTPRDSRHGERFSLVQNSQGVCRILNTVSNEGSEVVSSAIGQLNRYLSANCGVELPVQSSAQLLASGDWIVVAAGAAPTGLPITAALTDGIGGQGFVVQQMAAPSGHGRWLVVWGKTPLGCRYGLIELLRSIEITGKDCFTGLEHVRDEPVFPQRIYYHNFGEHLVNGFSVNMLYDVPFAQWTRAEWRSYLEMIAAMRYTTFEFWLSPTFFSSRSLDPAQSAQSDTYAEAMRWIVDQAHELGLKVEVLICVNTTEPTWIYLCPKLPEEHRRILDLWSHWTKKLSNADVFCIFPGDVGGCHRNGCTHETFIDLCLEIIAATQPNGAFTFEVSSWGPPFFDWGVPAAEATSERAKAAFACLLKRLPEFPNTAVYSVNMNRDINTLFSGAPRAPQYSNREIVDELRKSVPVLTWDYYLSEREEAVMPHYRVPAVLQARKEERTWGYSGGINYTMTPRLNILNAFAAAEAYWNPEQTEADVLRKFSGYAFGDPDVAGKVFPYVAMAGELDSKTFHERMRAACEALRSTRAPEPCKLFVTPNANHYAQSLLYYTTTYERLSAVAMEVQEVVSLTGKKKLSEVKNWLASAPKNAATDRVKALIAGWGNFDLAAVTRDYRSRVYGVYDLASGPNVRGEFVAGHSQAFIGQFGITAFFDTNAEAGAS